MCLGLAEPLPDRPHVSLVFGVDRYARPREKNRPPPRFLGMVPSRTFPLQHATSVHAAPTEFATHFGRLPSESPRKGPSYRHPPRFAAPEGAVGPTGQQQARGGLGRGPLPLTPRCPRHLPPHPTTPGAPPRGPGRTAVGGPAAPTIATAPSAVPAPRPAKPPPFPLPSHQSGKARTQRIFCIKTKQSQKIGPVRFAPKSRKMGGDGCARGAEAEAKTTRFCGKRKSGGGQSRRAPEAGGPTPTEIRPRIGTTRRAPEKRLVSGLFFGRSSGVVRGQSYARPREKRAPISVPPGGVPMKGTEQCARAREILVIGAFPGATEIFYFRKKGPKSLSATLAA